jgi:hypothetical protein
MPKEPEAGDNPHQIDKDDLRVDYAALPLFRLGVKPLKQILKTEPLKKVKEFVKEPGFAETINFRNIFSIGKVLGNAGLISVGGVPGESVGDILGSVFEDIHRD